MTEDRSPYKRWPAHALEREHADGPKDYCQVCGRLRPLKKMKRRAEDGKPVCEICERFK